MSAGLYCSEINRAHGLDPAGNATPFERFLLVEIPLPWPRSLLKSDGVTLYQRLRAVYNEALDAGHEVRITGLVPDDEWSTPGLTRVITYRRPEGDRFATYERDEHLLTTPDDIVVLARAFLLDDRDALARFDAQREPSDGRGDLLVCTHGTYDACCGTRGTPLYREARAELTEVRTWRVMHSGGHRYAPTAVTMPDGRAWAFLDMERTRQAVRHGGDHRQMVPLLRGWSGAASPWEQAAERMGFERCGWPWLHTPHRTLLLQADADRARVRVEHEAGGALSSYEADVAITRTIDLDACISSDELKTSRYAEYAVAEAGS